MVFNAVNIISVMSRRQLHLSMLLTSTRHNIRSKPLAAFPHDHRRNNAQWREKDKSRRNDYHQSLERIMAVPLIEPATSCSEAQYATDRATELDFIFWHLPINLQFLFNFYRMTRDSPLPHNPDF